MVVMPASCSAPAVPVPDRPIARTPGRPGASLALAGLLTLTVAAALTLGRGAIGAGGFGTAGPPPEPAAPVVPMASPVAPAAVPVVEPRVVTSSSRIERPASGAPDREAPDQGATGVPGVGAGASPGSVSIPAGTAGASASSSGAVAVRWEVREPGMLRVSLVAPTNPTAPGLGLRVEFVPEPSTQREALYVLCGQAGAGAWDLVVDGPVASVDVLDPAAAGSPGGCGGGTPSGVEAG